MRKSKNKDSDFSTSIVRLGLKIFHLKVSGKIENLLVQIFRFGIVGVIATIIDFIFLYFFKELCHLPIILSNTLSFTISVLYNYWASLTFVFNINQEKDKRKRFVIFIVCSVIGLILNDIIVWVVTDVFKMYYLISKVIATLIVMVFNFVTRKKFLE